MRLRDILVLPLPAGAQEAGLDEAVVPMDGTFLHVFGVYIVLVYALSRDKMLEI